MLDYFCTLDNSATWWCVAIFWTHSVAYFLSSSFQSPLFCQRLWLSGISFQLWVLFISACKGILDAWHNMKLVTVPPLSHPIHYVETQARGGTAGVSLTIAFPFHLPLYYSRYVLSTPSRQLLILCIVTLEFVLSSNTAFLGWPVRVLVGASLAVVACWAFGRQYFIVSSASS